MPEKEGPPSFLPSFPACCRFKRVNVNRPSNGPACMRPQCGAVPSFLCGAAGDDDRDRNGERRVRRPSSASASVSKTSSENLLSLLRSPLSAPPPQARQGRAEGGNQPVFTGFHAPILDYDQHQQQHHHPHPLTFTPTHRATIPSRAKTAPSLAAGCHDTGSHWKSGY